MIVVDEDTFDDLVTYEREAQQHRVVAYGPEGATGHDMIEQRVAIDVAADRVVQLGSAAMALQSFECVFPQRSQIVRNGTSPEDVHVSCYV